MTSIFTKIINKELPAEIIFENEHVIVIKDIHPVAPVHLLIITKKEIKNIQSMKENELFLLAEVGKAAQEVAKTMKISHYRLLTNCNEDAGQTVFHLHFHLISGRKLGTMA